MKRKEIIKKQKINQGKSRVAGKYFSKKKSGGQIFVCPAQSNLGEKLVKKKKEKIWQKEIKLRKKEREREDLEAWIR